MTAKTIVGRLAPNAWRSGDPLPEIGSLCLVSGANCDVESDQHRSYMWRKVVGYCDGDMFVCLQTEGCWPTVERTENCWFAEIPVVRNAAQQQPEPRAFVVPALDEIGLVPLPERMPVAVFKHATLGELYDRLTMHKFAVGYALVSLAAKERQRVEPGADERAAWEYSFIHSSATGRPDEKVGPCLTYDKAQAFGVGCIEQHAVFVRAAQFDQRAGAMDGWLFYSADFSMNASNPANWGTVMLTRDDAGRKWWHALSDEEREKIDLFVSGRGTTFAAAMQAANQKAAIAAPAQQEASQ